MTTVTIKIIVEELGEDQFLQSIVVNDSNIDRSLSNTETIGILYRAIDQVLRHQRKKET